MASPDKPDASPPKDPVPSYEERLARNLAMAFLAASHGYRSVDYVRKLYADYPVGEFWFWLARLVMEETAKRPSKAPLTPPSIQ